MLLAEMTRGSTLRMSVLIVLTLVLSSCDEAPTETEVSDLTAPQAVNFEATITGSYDGEVSGLGILVLLPEAGFENQGYFFLADGRGLRPNGVVFVLPRGIAPGRFQLQSPTPFDLGTIPSVRVDQDTGDATLSFDRNTSGFLNLTAFPDIETRLRGTDLAGVYSFEFEAETPDGPPNVAGNFEFETEDPEGRRITVSGEFSFNVGLQ